MYVYVLVMYKLNIYIYICICVHAYMYLHDIHVLYLYNHQHQTGPLDPEAPTRASACFRGLGAEGAQTLWLCWAPSLSLAAHVWNLWTLSAKKHSELPYEHSGGCFFRSVSSEGPT